MDGWQDWVGRTWVSTSRLDPAQADRMNATLDRDPGFADGDPLPPAWHWLWFPDVVRASDLGPEGHPRLGLTMPPVPLPRRMWAGGTLTFHRPLHLGATVERATAIRAVTPKQGRSGPLVFVTVAHELRADGRPCLTEQQTIVYRELPPRPVTGPGAGAVPDAAPDRPPASGSDPGAAFSASWALDSTALFRYSALTFNGHRIHYDADYCRDVEGYPGLVVHGPLLATLLLDLAVRSGRAAPSGLLPGPGPAGDPVPSRFGYRAVHPLFLPGPVTVHGRPDGDRTVLWAQGPDGRRAMDAELAPA